MVAHVIKRTGHGEPYLEHKLHLSIRSACLAVRALEGEAELIAARVTASVTSWIDTKMEVTSRDVREHAGPLLTALHAEAGYAYATLDQSL